jgi:hypothetical protein
MRTLQRGIVAISAFAVAAAVTLSAAQAQTMIRFATAVPEADTGEVLGMKAMKDYIDFKSGGASTSIPRGDPIGLPARF